MILRFFHLLIAAAYVGLFYYIYAAWGQQYWYLGLSYAPSTPLMALAIVLCLAYVFFTARSSNNVGALLVDAQFVITILPAMLVLAVQDYPVSQRLSVMLGLFSAQLFLRLIVLSPVPSLGTRTIALPKSCKVFAITISILLFAYMLVVYRHYFTFLSLDDVHTHRALVSGAVSAPLIGYVLGFLQTTAVPVFLAVGFFKRKFIFVAFATLIALLIYMALGSKLALAQLVMVAAYSIWVRRSILLTTLPIYLMFTGLLLVVAFIVSAGWAESYIGREISAVIFMRSFGIQAAQIGVYYDFFLVNPNTYYSHINILSGLIGYPYDASLGVTIGNFLGADGRLNANASLWATDGIAAADILGLYIIAILFGLFILLMKAVLPPSLIPIAVAASLPFLMACANGSLFTNLVTGGGIFLVFWIRWLALPVKGSVQQSVPKYA